MEKDGSEKVTVASLPLDNLISIFKFLDTDSKGKAAQVCSSWKRAANSKSIWKYSRIRIRHGNLNIQSKQSIIKRGIKRFDVYIIENSVNAFLRTVPGLEYLRFIGCCVKQNLREILDTIPNSAAFLGAATEENGPSPQDWEDFRPAVDQAFRNFHTLNNSSCICQHSNKYLLIPFTIGMKHLKELHLHGCLRVSSESAFDAGIELLFAGANGNRSTSLQKLCISHVWLISEKTIDYICKTFVNLVSLNIDVCTRVSSKGFVHLPKLEKLEFLSIVRSCDITDMLLNSISHVSNLKSLDLGFCINITENGLETISQLTNLIHLNLSYLSNITDAAFKHLNKLPRLRELGLHRSKISDEGLLYLAKGNLKLTKLDISFCYKVGDQGLFNICDSTFVLQILDISGCQITDYGVSRVIEKYPYLQIPDLSQCSFGNDESKQLIVEKLHRNKLNRCNIVKDYDLAILSSGRLDSHFESYLNTFWR